MKQVSETFRGVLGSVTLGTDTAASSFPLWGRRRKTDGKIPKESYIPAVASVVETTEEFTIVEKRDTSISINTDQEKLLKLLNVTQEDLMGVTICPLPPQDDSAGTD